MYFGNAWYPEHWPQQRWREDVRLMREAGMNVCRIAEFAWSSMEPVESSYEFDWLEKAVALLAENDIAVVLGTPTAAPPAWLTFHHPDTLAVEANGLHAQHGNRCHASPLSTTYHKYCRRIVEQMAQRFGKDKRVIGWQIDNEYNRVDYSEYARRQFQLFLKNRYGSLESLNQHWSTAYWSQTYRQWEEIPIPIGGHNPGLMLAFRHFVTSVWREFQRIQIDAIRQHAGPEQWIASNFMGWFDSFDHFEVCKDLDLVTWDWYVGTGHHDYVETGLLHDLNRGYKRRNFWIMETQPGSVNWGGVNNMLNRGEARCMALHAAAHGADGLLYWQWRPALGGQEQLHGSLLGADGKPRPFYTEAAEIGADFARLSEAVQNTAPQAKAAMLHSFDSRWAINFQRHHKDFDPAIYMLHCYRPLIQRGVTVDVTDTEAPLEGYKLLIAPALTVLPDSLPERLQQWVEAGGTLLLTPRTGQKDRHNALFPVLQPGPLRELAGTETREYYALHEPVPIEAVWAGAETGEAHIWAEMLCPLQPQVQVIARYGACNGWLDGMPAATRLQVGDKGGQVIVLGAWLNRELQDSFLNFVLQCAGISTLTLPEGVETASRFAADGSARVFVINHTRQTVTLQTSILSLINPIDILSGKPAENVLSLPPYGAVVLRDAAV